MAGQGYGVPFFHFRNLSSQICYLVDVFHGSQGHSFFYQIENLPQRLLSHSIHQHIRSRVRKNSGHQSVRPIIVMCHPTQGSFNTANENRHFRIYFFQNMTIGNSSVIRAKSGITTRRIPIRGSPSFIGGVMIDHGVHASGRHTKKVLRFAEFFKIPQIVLPVGLGDNPHLKTLVFHDTTNHRCAESRMVNVGITGDQNDIQFVPTPAFSFFFGNRQPIR